MSSEEQADIVHTPSSTSKISSDSPFDSPSMYNLPPLSTKSFKSKSPLQHTSEDHSSSEDQDDSDDSSSSTSSNSSDDSDHTEADDIVSLNMSPTSNNKVLSTSKTHHNEQKLIPHTDVIATSSHESIQQKIIYAIEQSNVAEIQRCLRLGINVNEAGKDENTYLHTAVHKGDVEVVQCLLENKADLHCTTKHGNTPLHLAVNRGFMEIVRLLVSNKAGLERQNNGGNTPLHTAVLKGYKDPTVFLLSQSFDHNIKNNEGNTALHLAAIIGRSVKDLITKCDADIENNEGNTVLHLACDNNRQRMVDILLKHNVKVDRCNNEGNTPLHCAVKWGFTPLVSALISQKCDINIPNHRGCTPLDIAMIHQRTSTMKLLMLHGAIHGATSMVDSSLNETHVNSELAVPQMVRGFYNNTSFDANEGFADELNIPIIRQLQPSRTLTISNNVHQKRKWLPSMGMDGIENTDENINMINVSKYSRFVDSSASKQSRPKESVTVSRNDLPRSVQPELYQQDMDLNTTNIPHLSIEQRISCLEQEIRELRQERSQQHEVLLRIIIKLQEENEQLRNKST